MTDFNLVADLITYEKDKYSVTPDLKNMSIDVLLRVSSTYNQSDIIREELKRRKISNKITSFEKVIFTHQRMAQLKLPNIKKPKISHNGIHLSEKLIAAGHAKSDDFANPKVLFKQRYDDTKLDTAVNWYLYLKTGYCRYLQNVDWSENNMDTDSLTKCILIEKDNGKRLEAEINNRGIRVNFRDILRETERFHKLDPKIIFIAKNKSKFFNVFEEKLSKLEESIIDAENLFNSYYGYYLNKTLMDTVDEIYFKMKNLINLEIDNVIMIGSYLLDLGFNLRKYRIIPHLQYVVNIKNSIINVKLGTCSMEQIVDMWSTYKVNDFPLPSEFATKYESEIKKMNILYSQLLKYDF